MDKPEFDKFADEYLALHANNLRLSGEGPDYFAEYKVRDFAEYLAGEKRIIGSILDFGAGVGTSVPWFRRYFPEANLTCIDVSGVSLAIAASRFPENADFIAFDGRRIPARNATFDAAFTACVFHHIKEELHIGLLQEIRRVLKPTGTFALFEHNPMNPLTVNAVKSCPFDENAVLIPSWEMRKRLRIAGFAQTRVRYRIFFPRALRALRVVEPALRWCPIGAQYSIFAAGALDHGRHS